MSVLAIPNVTTLQFYSMEVSLEGVTYSLTFRWNSREAAWHMDIALLDGTMLLAGLKLVVGWPLTARFINSLLPPGEFVLVDTSGSGLDPGIDELGGRCALLYYESTSLPASLTGG